MEVKEYNETMNFLNHISEHLRKNRAAVLIGAGFSRNADKVDESVPNPPLWEDLSTAFIEKLDSSGKELERLQKVDPLTLAERVEVLFGRPELDNLLLDCIKDRDYLPSCLHKKLLSLPWSDIFTTNYDTLLERANEEISERTFRVVTTKEDLLGSAGKPRIVKLHGSFPSSRPFIITAEDYRTYPQKFAPFVNTVQQSLLENTLCLIGFSGDDPNFQKWVGWIRDNLGRENMPKIYYLQHDHISSADRKMLEHNNIIPIDLSLEFHGKTPSEIYLKALDYIGQHQEPKVPGHWKIDYPFYDSGNKLVSLAQAKRTLQHIRETYPGWITLHHEALELFRDRVIFPIREILAQYCKEIENVPASEDELLFLYEYNWAHEKALLPILDSELKDYLLILNRHSTNTKEKIAILFSLLRDYRILGEWERWSQLVALLENQQELFDYEQKQELSWEKSLHDMTQYQFDALSKDLENWNVKTTMSLWVLRKSGLLAENGEYGKAYDLLSQGIIDIRRRLSHQRETNLRLLSLESAMMSLKDFINVARHIGNMCSSNIKQSRQIDNRKPENILSSTNRTVNTDEYDLYAPVDQENYDSQRVDARHQAIHNQYDVAWKAQNAFLMGNLASKWTPSRITVSGCRNRPNSLCLSDKEFVSAYTFLRFREETGVPFFINSVNMDRDAACGAAERLANYYPEWSMLTVVRTDYYKSVCSVLANRILSNWSQKDADEICKVYIKAILLSEQILQPSDWFFRRSFARVAADVLPEALSELCRKCSEPVLNELLNLLRILYCSKKKGCYQQIRSLTNRLITVYPNEKKEDLILRLLKFPIIDKEDPNYIYYPDPLTYVPFSREMGTLQSQSNPLVEDMFAQCKNDLTKGLSRLIYCFEHGLFTDQQRIRLSNLIWNNDKLCVPMGWLRTICLSLPAPQDIDTTQYMAEVLTRAVEGYIGKGPRAEHDFNLLNEVNAVALNRQNAFSPEQVSTILFAFSERLRSLANSFALDFGGMSELTKHLFYSTLHSMWLITSARTSWIPSDNDKNNMREILETCEKVNARHFGLQSYWKKQLNDLSEKDYKLQKYICNPDKYCSEWGYRVLAIAIRQLHYGLLPEEDICSGLNVITQQIQWRAPFQLSLALQVIDVAVTYRPQLLSRDMVWSIMTGIEYLAQETRIEIIDTNEIAASKIELRMNTAKIINNLKKQKLRLFEEYTSVIGDWIQIISNDDEFAEIRNV